MAALSDAKKKGKKKSHKKKTSAKAESTVESQNADQKSTLFPKPVKKIVDSDLSHEKSTPSNLGLATTLTTEGPIGQVGSKGPRELTQSTAASIGLTGSTASVGLAGSTASVGLTGTTPSVVGLAGATTLVTLKGSTAFVGTTVSSGGALGSVGPTTLGPAGSTVTISSLKTVGLLGTLVSTGTFNTNNGSTVKQSTVNITTTTQQSNSSNVTTTEAVMDNNEDDEMENEEASVEDNRSDEQSFFHDFRLTNDEPTFSKYDQDDDETFTTEPMLEYRRKKRHANIRNTDSRKKR